MPTELKVKPLGRIRNLPEAAHCRYRCENCGRVITPGQYRIGNVEEYSHPYLSQAGAYHENDKAAHKDCSLAVNGRGRQ